MAKTGVPQVMGWAMLAVTTWAQPVKTLAPPGAVVTVEQPDAQRTRDELSQLLDRYPPALRGVLGLDPSLLTNQAYLAPYPALVAFLGAHSEVARNPPFISE